MQEKPYTCEDSERDMDFFFQLGVGTIEDDGKTLHRDPIAEAALQRSLAHMTAGTTIEKHNIACQKCWNRYMGLKRIHCGG